MGGLTPVRVAHEYTIPQLAVIWDDERTTSADPFSLKPTERVITSADLEARRQRKSAEKIATSRRANA